MSTASAHVHQATRRVPVLQPSLRVGSPMDPLEAEADAVADRVLRMPSAAAPAGVIQRCPGGCPGEEDVQRKPTGQARRGGDMSQDGGDRAVEPATAGVIRSARTGGAALPGSVRGFFEPRFGADLSAVRVHADDRAAGLAAAVNARAFTVGRDVFFGADEFRPGADSGKRLIAHELAHTLQQRASAAAISEGVAGEAVPDGHAAPLRHHAGEGLLPAGPRIQRQQSEGPQTFAPVGATPVDPALLQRNAQVEAQLFIAADYYRNAEDLRWFFAHAHAMITRQINDNIGLFRQPNALIRLNLHFATEFLRALAGQSHSFWEQAFRECQALQRASGETAFLVGEAEACAARMAQVHIHVDLRAALEEVGCIPPQDYGNVLVFVNRGSLAAMVELRGQALGAAQAMIERLVAPVLDLEVEQWRNAAYSDVCNTEVSGVDPSFSEGLR